MPHVVPQPVSMVMTSDGEFRVEHQTRIVVRPGSRDAVDVGEYLARLLRASTGYALPLVVRPGAGLGHAIVLDAGGPADLDSEGYTLESGRTGILLRGHGAEGLFRGVQTLRQLLPPKVESTTPRHGPWRVPAVRIEDAPRFTWRGAMLDVARHFFGVDTVEQYIDLLAMYKINMLHLHLSDDQGWRIAIDSWPRLATYGGSTEVGGGPGGYYTKAEYEHIVAYAKARYIEVVPEIDSPSHTNAALASYAELNCDGKAPPLYTGTTVGFSSLCVDKPVTYRFYDDVVREIGAMTPGPYFHLGGDEAHSTSHDDYVTFVNKAQGIVADNDKTVDGWQEIAAAHLRAGSTVQYWGTGDERSAKLAQRAAAQGGRIVMSPANRVYLDMKYNEDTELGLHWAGYVTVRESYDWDPATQVPGVAEADIAGVEAALWSETLQTLPDIEYMAFPRLPGAAEIGWSPKSARDWDEYKTRLAAQGRRWDVLGINYYRAPGVPWGRG